MRLSIAILTVCSMLAAATPRCMAGQESPVSGPALLLETGIRAGGAAGVEGPGFSTIRVNTDIGLLYRRSGGADVGLSLHLAAGREDLPVALKPRVRLDLSRQWRADLSAGPLIGTLEMDRYVTSTGFTGGIMLIFEDWLGLGADVLARKIEDRPVYSGGKASGIAEGGWEYGIYGGMTMTGRPGIAASILWGALVLGFSLIVLDSLSS